MMTQTLAILLDAYRELQAKKMFWIVLILNALTILAFGLLGVRGNTMTFLWYDIGQSPRMLYEYKVLYSTAVVGIWFTWIAVLLALISTSGIFPDFMSSGSVDLFLAKPISRLRLFFTKYLAGMLFAALQVSLFAFLSFLVLGIRAGVWEPGIFLAIPLVLLMFSYLFAACVLLGTLTRSVIASLFLAILFWGGIAGLDWVHNRVVEAHIGDDQALVDIDQAIQDLDQKIARAQTEPDTATGPSSIGALQAQRENYMSERADAAQSALGKNAETTLYVLKSIFPKTRETTNLMDRFLFSDKEMRETVSADQQRLMDAPQSRRRERMPGWVVDARLEQERSTSTWWIVGTSLLFEAVCLVLGAWRFCTRDF